MTYKAVGRAEDILLEQIREAVRARDKAERAEAILPIPEGLWKGVVAACGFAVGSYQFRTRLSALARRFPLFEDRIAVLANAKASIDPTRYSAATYLRDMPEGIKLLLDRIILSRDPQGSSGGRNLDYEAEIREALTSIGIYDIYGAAVANITVREIVQAYLSGVIKSTQQRPF